MSPKLTSQTTQLEALKRFYIATFVITFIIHAFYVKHQEKGRGKRTFGNKKRLQTVESWKIKQIRLSN